MTVQTHATDSERIPALMTAGEIAEALNLSLPSIYKLMESGALPYQKFGRSRRAKRADVLKLIEESTVTRA